MYNVHVLFATVTSPQQHHPHHNKLTMTSYLAPCTAGLSIYNNTSLPKPQEVLLTVRSQLFSHSSSHLNSAQNQSCLTVLTQDITWIKTQSQSHFSVPIFLSFLELQFWPAASFIFFWTVFHLGCLIFAIVNIRQYHNFKMSSISISSATRDIWS